MPSPSRGRRFIPRTLSSALVMLMALALPVEAATVFVVHPPAVQLDGPFARAQLVVTQGQSVTERSADLTGRATFQSARPDVVLVGPTGQVMAVANGETVVTVRVDGVERPVPVKVSGVSPTAAVGFTDQVIPMLARLGCNTAACHAAQYGKGGFKLSVFASDLANDHQAMVRAGMGRRVSFIDPTGSLLLQKATGEALHGGGKRLDAPATGGPVTPGHADYLLLRQWIATGAPGPAGNAPKATDLEVVPPRRIGGVGQPQQLRVVARYADGKSRDVTGWAKFDSTDDGVVRVNANGLANTVGRGQGAVMVRFDGHAVLARFIVPYADKIDLAGWTDQNFIDRLARVRFEELGISPSPLCDDATFLRRATLDATGTLPTVEQARAFLTSTDPHRRQKLIDRLLGLTGDPAQDVHTDAFAAYWSLKWADLLKSNSSTLTDQGMWSMHNWLKESVRRNKPIDRVVRELVTARGNPYDSGPANYFVSFQGAEAVAEATSQVFLGMRVTCAKCHHHPFERISQADFRGLANFFGQVASKPSAGYGKLGGPSVILVRADDTAQPMPKTVLGLPVPKRLEGGKLDRRELLADWLTAAETRLLARNVANRFVAYLLGRGLVEPIDDLRATNAPSNPELLEALTDDFIKSGYNVRHLMRTIMTSRLYGLSSQPTGANATDNRFYSHYLVKRLGAEVLLDAVDAVTGSPTRFPKLPLGTRAIDLPDSRYDNYLLTVFGKPRREGVCECERMTDPNLAQALHTLNSDTIAAKIADSKGRVARLLAEKRADAEIVDELYLAAVSRRPTAAEQTALAKLRAETPDRTVFYQDLLWSLINSKQFLFVR